MKTRKKFYSSFQINVAGVVGEKLINSLAKKAEKLNPGWTKDHCEKEVKDWVQAELVSFLELELESQIESRWDDIEKDVLATLSNYEPH